MNLLGKDAFGEDRGESLGANGGALDANASRGALDTYTNHQVGEPHIDLVRKTQEINY